MYKDVLEKLKKDRRIDKKFIKRLEKKGFKIDYDKFNYWDGCEYIQIENQKIWLVEMLYKNRSACVEYRWRNDVIEEIKHVIEYQNS